MNNPLLTWEAADETPAMIKARENLQKLDTTEVVNEMEEHAQLLEEQRRQQGIGAKEQPQSLNLDKPAGIVNSVISDAASNALNIQPITINNAVGGDAFARAVAAVARYSQQMEFGERIKAVDKRLINSKTDLNQLIPFKYTWAWSMYLDSTEAHWMPAEADGYLTDVKQWPTLLTSQKKLVYRFVVNYIYSQCLYRPEMLVNLYRLSTNPEVRQYELRQAFEEQAFHHTVRHIVETFDLATDNIRALTLDETTLRERNIALYPYIAKMGDMETSTASDDEIGDFIVSLSVIYGVMRTLYHMVPMYQLWKFHKTTGNLPGVAQNVGWVLRDMNRQFDFGVRYINGILAENPGVLKERHVNQIRKLMNIAHVANGDFLSTLIVSDDDILEGEYCSKWFMNHFLNNIGIPTETVKVKPEYDGFIDYFLSQNTKDHGTAQVALGQSSGGSTGGGSLDWG